MTDMTAAVVLLLKDRLSPAMKKIVSGFKQLKTAADQVNRSGRGYGLAKQFTDAEVKARKLRLEINRLHGVMGRIKAAGVGFGKRALGVGGALWAARGLYYGYAASMVGQILGPAKEMEMFRMQLEQLEGSAAGGKKAMAWITDFAKRTPLEMNQVIDAYAQLRNFGMDPTNGSLQALVDTMSMSGKGFENLDSIILGMGQAWTKQKLQGDDARQLMEAGVPVWDLLAKKMGKSAAEVIKLSEKGKLGRKEIQLLVDAMGERAAGASDRFATSWTGITSNLQDAWYQFRVAIADSGPFQELKSNLQGILDTVNQMQADGRLQQLATQIGGNLKEAIQNAAAAARGLWWAGTIVAGVLARLAELAGGYDNLAYYAAGLYLVGSSLSLIKSLGEAAVILGKIGALTTGGSAGGLLGIAGGLAAIAGSLFLLEQYKPDILDRLDALRPGDPASRQPLPAPKPQMVAGQDIAVRAGQVTNEWIRAEYAKLDAAWQAWSSSMRAKAAALGQQITSAIVSGLGSLFSAGAELVVSLGEGMKAKFGELLASVSSWGSQIKAAVMSGTTVTPAPFRGGRFAPAPAAPPAGSPGHDGARAMGGSIYKGGTYLTGERGPELITAQRYGAVTPLGKGRAGTTVHVTVGGITINGNADRGAIAELADKVAARIRQGLHDGAYA